MAVPGHHPLMTNATTIRDQLNTDIDALTNRTAPASYIRDGWVDHLRELVDSDDDDVSNDATEALTGNRECLARSLRHLAGMPFASLLVSE